MKTKAIVLICLIGVIVLSVGYDRSFAESKENQTFSKTGVVNVRKILQECKRSAKYREESLVERDRIVAELEKLNAEVEAGKAGLKTLKPGSSDYMELVKDLLMKQASLQAQQEFHKQQMGMKEQKMIEDIYKDVLQHVSKVAQEKGLDLVLEKAEPEFPIRSAEELTRTIDTHKLLYSGGCVDITSEVLARLNAAE